MKQPGDECGLCTLAYYSQLNGIRGLSGMCCAHYRAESWFSSPPKSQECIAMGKKQFPEERRALQTKPTDIPEDVTPKLEICSNLFVQLHSTECLMNIVIFPTHWFLNFHRHGKHLQGLLKHRPLGSTPQLSGFSRSPSKWWRSWWSEEHTLRTTVPGFYFLNYWRASYPNEYHSWVYFTGKIFLIFQEDIMPTPINIVAVGQLLNHSANFFLCKMDVMVLTSYVCCRKAMIELIVTYLEVHGM